MILQAFAVLSFAGVTVGQDMSSMTALWNSISTCAQGVISTYMGVPSPTASKTLNLCRSLDYAMNDIVYALQAQCAAGTETLPDQYDILTLENWWAKEPDCVHSILQQLNFGSPPAGGDILTICQWGSNFGSIIANNMDPTICPGFTTNLIPAKTDNVSTSIKFLETLKESLFSKADGNLQHHLRRYTSKDGLHNNDKNIHDFHNTEKLQ
ncbi:hypothetical protein HDU84_002408 [Entophlyctis sp. JEL0112]|nr:hypothetical protein HDU84_002408 [Entophlyctis sp. JEL0112]